MSDNLYTGETVLRLGKKELRLVFDWRALAELRTLYGDGFGEQAFETLSSGDPERVAQVLAVALRRHHQEEGFTPESIMDLSPPFGLTIQALQRALLRAHFGDRDPPKVEASEAADPQPAGGT